MRFPKFGSRRPANRITKVPQIQEDRGDRWKSFGLREVGLLNRESFKEPVEEHLMSDSGVALETPRADGQRVSGVAY